MKIKVGDNVKILAGKDKGKTGKVVTVLRKLDKVVVEGINIVKKHQKPTNANDKGGIVEMPAPIHISNVQKVTEEKTEKKTTAKKTTKKKETKKEGE